MKDSGAKIILALGERLDVAQKAAVEAGLSPDSVFVFDRPEGDDAPSQCGRGAAKSWTSLWAPASEAKAWTWKTINTQKEAMETTAVINYSSGYAHNYPPSYAPL